MLCVGYLPTLRVSVDILDVADVCDQLALIGRKSDCALCGCKLLSAVHFGYLMVSLSLSLSIVMYSLVLVLDSVSRYL